MKRITTLLMSVMACALLGAQTWYSADQGNILFGQGWTSEIGKSYQRLPAAAQSKVTSSVWNLSKNTAGLNVRFRTDAKTVYVKYTLTGSVLSYHNMPVTLQSGVDLYALDEEGTPHWVSSQKNFTFSGSNATYTYANLDHAAVSSGEECEYMLYFPMYNGVSEMSVGVPEGSSFEYQSVPEADRPIVAYGTSITQGCSASRPGMAWTSIVGRELGSNVINLGFSGSAFMESGIFDMLAELKDAKLYIIDAIPNIKSSPAAIVSRTVAGVKKLREVSDAPILLVESFGNSDKVMSPTEDNIDSRGNERLREAYEAIVDEEIKNVFYMTEEEIGATEDAMIEGTHPNDIGMREYADAYVKKINWLFDNIDTTKVNDQHPLYATVRQAKQMMKTWRFGSDAGETPLKYKAQMETLLTDAQHAIDTNSCDAQCEGMKAALVLLMEEIRANRNPLEEGYYYIVSAYDGFMDSKGYEMAMYTKGSALNWAKLNTADSRYVYKLTKQDDGNWLIQNCATAEYINTAAAQKSLTMSREPLTEQVIKEATEWSARYRISNTANSNPYIPNSNYFGAAEGADVFNQSESVYNANDPTSQAYGWQTWYFRSVSDEALLDEIIKQMPTKETKELQAALSEAQAAYDRAMALQADEDKPLITEYDDNDPDHNQYSSNAKMPENTRVWGYYRNLNDNDRGTFFISIHDRTYGEPTEPHYLQVDLKDNPVDAFIFRYGRSSNWPTFSWKDVTVYATNDAENGPWAAVAELADLPSDNVYDSEIVRMNQKYRHVRFSVTGTEGNLVVGAGPAFAIGEFQMYPVSPSDDAPYFTDEAVKSATDALSADIAKAKELLAANTATAEDISKLNEATATLLAAIRGDNATELLEPLLEEAIALYDTFADTEADESDNLITEADDDDAEHNQLSSNAKMPDVGTTNWGRYAYLIDGNAATYFISIHNRTYGEPKEPHYLQVDLRDKPQDAFIFHFVKSTTWPTFTWTDIDVLASNDAENWTHIANLSNLPTDASYDSGCIRLWQKYRYVRFSVNKTVGNLTIGEGPAFCIGDFQMYPAKPSANSFYSLSSEGKAAGDALWEAIVNAHALVAGNTAKQSDINALREKMEAVTTLMQSAQELEAAVAEAKELYLQAKGEMVADESEPLVSEASDDDPDHNQYLCNAKYPYSGKYANLIDGNLSSYFFSLHNASQGTPPAGYHNMQVDLRDKPQEAIAFRYGRNPSWPTFAWKTVQVWASNDAEDWTEIATLTNLPTETDVTYYDRAVQLWGKYRYVRFDVVETASNSPIIGGGPAYCIGELQIFPASASESAPYSTDSNVKAKADALYAGILQAQAKVEARSATAEDVNQLTSLIATLKNEIYK